MYYCWLRMFNINPNTIDLIPNLLIDIVHGIYAYYSVVPALAFLSFRVLGRTRSTRYT